MTSSVSEQETRDSLPGDPPPVPLLDPPPVPLLDPPPVPLQKGEARCCFAFFARGNLPTVL